MLRKNIGGPPASSPATTGPSQGPRRRMALDIPSNVKRSVYCAVGLLLLGTCVSVCMFPSSTHYHKRYTFSLLRPSSCLLGFPAPSLFPLHPPILYISKFTGVAMFVSGMILWRVEGIAGMLGLWICGLLVFIPGVYFTRIAYHAYKGTEGYSWADIPDWPEE